LPGAAVPAKLPAGRAAAEERLVNSLAGKVAVVTGGASGIGAATARLFAAAGARVVLGDLQDAGPVAKEIDGLFVPTDVRDSDAVRALVERAAAEHGRLDVLFNNAGIELHAPLADTDDAQHRNLVDVNLVFYGLKWGVRAMLRNPGPVRGSIVSTASVAGLVGTPGLASYDAAKHAVVGLTKTAALEYGALGIRVNAVCPGVIRTPMLVGLSDGGSPLEPVLAQLHALRRIGEPEEVARLVCFLASEDASFDPGQAIAGDGGLTAGIPAAPQLGETD
jgi:NAD(P)-dependent dehydrogenase (short-subunit alcohol dehydrogenase family)